MLRRIRKFNAKDSIYYFHKILKELSNYRHANDSFFGPDSKSQVSVLYENNKPKSISSIVVSSQDLKTQAMRILEEKF